MKCGLVGRTLDHSYSPEIHRYLGNYQYSLFPLEPRELKGFFARRDFTGVNVTMPYKRAVMAYCSRIEDNARRIGAVNTVINSGGELTGYNTDYYGFTCLIKKLCTVSGRKALVLGSGGAAKTACAAISDLGGHPVVISRNGGPGHSYVDISLHYPDTDIIVNATPVGMYPDNLRSPLNLEEFSRLSAVADVIYNPARTRLLLDAERLGIPIANGLYMLAAQAEEASRLFTGGNPPCHSAPWIARRIAASQMNLVLIGMPGSGKTTLGKAAAALLGRTFADTDWEAARLAGKTPRDIITSQGESSFREVEAAALKELCKRSSLVIATRGGAVTRPENIDAIRQNAVVVWVRRPLSMLSAKSRPLSSGPEALEALYRQREPLYSSAADFVIENDGTENSAVQKIIELINPDKE